MFLSLSFFGIEFTFPSNFLVPVAGIGEQGRANPLICQILLVCLNIPLPTFAAQLTD